MAEREGDISGGVDAGDGADSATADAHHVTRLSYGRHLRILLVDRDDDSADAFDRAAEEAVLDVNIDRASGVDDAVERLIRAVGRRRRIPDIVVSSLDVDDSHELLARLRADERLDGIPVLVLSHDPTASLERRSFALGAAGHLRIPRVGYERVALVHALPDFMPNARAALAKLEARR